MHFLLSLQITQVISLDTPWMLLKYFPRRDSLILETHQNQGDLGDSYQDYRVGAQKQSFQQLCHCSCHMCIIMQNHNTNCKNFGPCLPKMLWKKKHFVVYKNEPLGDSVCCCHFIYVIDHYHRQLHIQLMIAASTEITVISVQVQISNLRFA